MDNQQNISLVRKLFDEVFSGGNISGMDQFFSNDVRLHCLAAPHFSGGLASLKENEQSYRNALPDKMAKIENIFSADDNRVVVYWTCTGTNKGQLDDISATNRPVRISGISIYTLKNGKISDIYQSWDRLGLLEQLGVVEERMTALHR